MRRARAVASLSSTMSFRPRNAVPFATQSGGAPRFMFQPPKPKEAAQQKFDYFLVMDFEATCLPNGEKISPPEIIEFPCLKLNSKTLAVESQFHNYVKPVVHPKLHLFCTELTGITQDMVNSENNFKDVFQDFQKWLQDENLLQDTSRFAFVTCGDWDLRIALRDQCALSSVEVPDYFNSWINIKKSVHQHTGNFPSSLPNMLKQFNLKFEGRQHSGIDDSKNISNVVVEMIKKGFILDKTTSIET